MIGLDCNILVQLAFADHPVNAKTLAAVQTEIKNGEKLVFPTLVVAEFLHAVTSVDNKALGPSHLPSQTGHQPRHKTTFQVNARAWKMLQQLIFTYIWSCTFVSNGLFDLHFCSSRPRGPGGQVRD
jgi:predicted nucleic acid-binding protein